MEKRTPHCELAVVKAMVAAGKVRATVPALAGRAALGFGFGEIAGAVAATSAPYCPVTVICTRLPAASQV